MNFGNNQKLNFIIRDNKFIILENKDSSTTLFKQTLQGNFNIPEEIFITNKLTEIDNNNTNCGGIIIILIY